MEAGCKGEGVVAREQLSLFTLKKALFCSLTFNWQNLKKKAELIAWKEKKDYPVNKGNNKITELRTILQRESQNS